MKKFLAVSVISLSLLSACGQGQVPMTNNGVRSMSANPLQASNSSHQIDLNKPAGGVKAGTSGLQIAQSKGLPKQAGTLSIRIDPVQRDLSTSDIMTIARIGLSGMDSARTWQDGYNVGYQTLQSLAAQNSFIAKLGVAAVAPQMGYEAAYKVVAAALNFIASNQQISVSASCDLIRGFMNTAKTWEEGARIGYASMAFIRNNGASPSITAVIDASVSTAHAAHYWEDAYNILNNAFAQLRSMN